MKWTASSPHPSLFDPESHPGHGLGDHNYCRNPDGDSTIWCYTTDPNQQWDYCEPIRAGGDVPQNVGVRLVRSVNGIGDESAFWKWDVYNLRFYSDHGCTQELDVDSGEPIASGWYDSPKQNYFSPHAALGWQGKAGLFGGRVDDDGSGRIWIGEKWATPQTIKCASFNMHHRGASQVTIEFLQSEGEWVPFHKVFHPVAGDNQLVL